MSLTEQSRHQLFEELDRILGPEKAATLMELLPPVGWADVATKRDLDRLGDALRGEMATLDASLRGELARIEASLRGDMAMLEASLRGELTTTGATLDGKIDTFDASLRAEMQQTRAEFHRDQHNQTIAIIGANATITGILFAAFRFL